MKGLKILMIALFFLLSGERIAAQRQGRFPQVRERLSGVRLNQIAQRMGLEKERLEQLRPLYLEFEREKQELMDGRLVRQMPISPDSITNEQAEQLFFLQMEKAKRMIDVREKYFKEFKKVLSPKEIIRFHRIEREVNKRMMEQIKNRFKNFER